MFPVFGRYYSTSHPYEGALATWLASTNSGYKAIARNIMHDHRVSEQREKLFDDSEGRPRTAFELQRAITRYFETKIQRRKLPHYVYQSVNENNILSGSTSGHHIIHKDLLLVRIIDLNGLQIVFQWARNKGLPLFRSFPVRIDDESINNWLDGFLSRRSIPEIKQFVEGVLSLLDTYRLFAPYQPTWVTTWAAFEPFLPEGPDRWFQVLGVKRLWKPRWVIILKYTVREAGTVARPTQLDAGWESYHFPSPPQAYLEHGGHPMDLRLIPPPTTLLPEFIHKQIYHPIEHWTVAGSICEKTVGGNLQRLENQRRNHYNLLLNKYGSSILAWMPDCI